MRLKLCGWDVKFNRWGETLLGWDETSGQLPRSQRSFVCTMGRDPRAQSCDGSTTRSFRTTRSLSWRQSVARLASNRGASESKRLASGQASIIWVSVLSAISERLGVSERLGEISSTTDSRERAPPGWDETSFLVSSQPGKVFSFISPRNRVSHTDLTGKRY